MTRQITVIGGGLAGCEAAWQAAERGLEVTLYEMRPKVMTGAHKTGYLAELVCSNSLGSLMADRASGCLLGELEQLGSLIVKCAFSAAIPSGGALAVDRELFASCVTKRIESHPNIKIVNEEITQIPLAPTIIATGPLSSGGICKAIEELSGKENLYFFDAIAPIITYESIDKEKTFRASRYNRGILDEGDYINCPFDKPQFEHFVNELLTAERYPLKEFEKEIDQGVKAGNSRYFEGCLPIEVMAQRNPQALLFGPLRPVGLKDPRTGKRPYAVVQLRQDDYCGSLYNIVGFQTNLTISAQKRIVHLIPGLEGAEIVRFGQMHRNSFICSPLLLDATMQFRQRESLFFAGQITGVEGYLGSVASGWVAGVNAARWIKGKPLWILPPTTMVGALMDYIAHAEPHTFQPMKANFGLLPPMEMSKKLGKKERTQQLVLRANRDLKNWQRLWENEN